jgi:ABC-type glycerol-3-phosphate transport system substrate-binding protein
MKKFIYFLLIILLSSIALSGCGSEESKTGPAAKAAKSYLMDSYIKEIKILDVKIEEDYAGVKVKVIYGEDAPSYYPSEKNRKVTLEKYGNEWEVLYAR